MKLSNTAKYYLVASLAAPPYAALLVTSKLGFTIAFVLGGISMILSIMGGFYLGRRDADWQKEKK